ncbi:MAG: hypothetical protein ACAI35_07735 [Candidatus Methylacidiphilales bacterium]|nr:hypothetical protein [Candidatus Methylacidiphilales bacterium]
MKSVTRITMHLLRFLVAVVALSVLQSQVVARAAEKFTKEEIITALRVDVPKLTDFRPESKSLPTGPGALPPNPQHQPYLEALEKNFAKTKDPELVVALLRYQLAHLSPENVEVAKVLGRAYIAQPEAFTTVYKQFRATAQVLLAPYLGYGYGYATRFDQTSRTAMERKRKFDRVLASLMNARTSDDAPDAY